MIIESKAYATIPREEFVDEVRRKLYFQTVIHQCWLEDCCVTAKHGKLIFPSGCTPDCGCRQRVENYAREMTGYDTNIKKGA